MQLLSNFPSAEWLGFKEVDPGDDYDDDFEEEDGFRVCVMEVSGRDFEIGDGMGRI